MSTKEVGYVRSILWLLSKTLKVVASSFYLFPLFLWKGYSATLVIRWYACELLGNFDRKEGNLA